MDAVNDYLVRSVMVELPSWYVVLRIGDIRKDHYGKRYQIVCFLKDTRFSSNQLVVRDLDTKECVISNHHNLALMSWVDPQEVR